MLLIPLVLGFVLSTSCNRPETDLLVPPQALITVSSDTLLTTTHIQFDCSKSIAGNVKDEIYYRWDWNSDGIWDEEYSGDPVFVHRFYSKPRALFQINPDFGNRITEFTFYRQAPSNRVLLVFF